MLAITVMCSPVIKFMFVALLKQEEYPRLETYKQWEQKYVQMLINK